MSEKTKKNTNHSYREPEFYNIWRRIFLFLVTHIFYMIRFKLVYRLEVYGKENIPKDNNFIIASNHLSTLDPPLICAIMDRGVAYMAKIELFKNPFLRWWLNWLGAFAVDRDNVSVSTMKTVKAIRKTNWVLGIFPQGTRQLDGEIKNLTKGFASIAKSNKCGILPIGITGTEEAKRIPFSGKIVVKIGEVIPYSDNVDDMVEKWGMAVQNLTGFKYISNLQKQEI